MLCGGGLREAVLERNGYRCRVCDAFGGRKRKMIVHHRIPGKWGCRAKIHHTKAVFSIT